MNPALLAALALAAVPAPSHLRYPAGPRPSGAALALVGGKPGHGYVKVSRPREDVFCPALPDSPAAAVVAAPFRYVPETEPPQTLEAAFLGTGRVHRVRVVVTVNGRPAGVAWADAVRKLFNAFDRDGDGTLNKHELDQVFSLPGLKELSQGSFYTQAFAVPSMAEIDRDGDRRVSVDELLHYYQAAAADLLQTRPMPPNDADADRVTEAVLAHLDSNRDGRLSEAELRKAERLLLTLDASDDECLSFGEVMANAGRKEAAGMMAGGAGMMGAEQTAKPADDRPGDLFAKLGELPGDTYARILKRYDADGDGKLSGDEIPFDAATAKALDADGDGKLTLTELYAWGKRPPDVVVTLNQAATAADCFVTVTGGVTAELPAGLVLRRTEPNRVILRSGATVLDFAAAPADTKGVRRRFDQMVAGLGGNGDAITEASLAGSPNQFLRVIFDAADRNSDGKLTRRELADYFQLQLTVAEQAVLVNTTVSRPNLFQLLDDDRDGKLSVRELRTAWERLSVLEPEGARFVTRAVLQPAATFRLTNAAATGFEVPTPDQPQAVPVSGPYVEPEGKGPLWFRKMDRNADGDVSKAEFLGDAADFAKIDANGDGLISLDEALAFDKRPVPAAKPAPPVMPSGPAPPK